MQESERPSKIRKLSHADDTESAELHAQDDGLKSVNDAAADNPKSSASNETNQDQPPDGECVDDTALGAKSQNEGEAQAPLSKNQLKKLKKKEAWEAGRDDRKLKRKEKDREKKARRKAAIKEAIADGREHEVSKIQHPDRRPRPIRRTTLPIAFMLDCGFDEFMLERESISLGTQITRSYSEYMKSPYQPHLVVSGWTKDNENRKRFEGLLRGMYKNWTGVVFTEEDFVGASLIADSKMKGPKGGRMVAAFERYAPPKAEQQQTKPHNGDTVAQVPDSVASADIISTSNEGQINGQTNHMPSQAQGSTTSEHFKALQEQGEVIYLTSDSPDTLTELKPYHTYIIGGIVDKNRHKGLCYKRALDANLDPNMIERLRGRKVKTAKLPIGEYMQMASRQVLATNHVVEIMLRWLDCRDWAQAFLEVMPKRKGAKLKDEANDTVDTSEDLDHDDDAEVLQDGNDAELAAHEDLGKGNGNGNGGVHEENNAEAGDAVDDSAVRSDLAQ